MVSKVRAVPQRGGKPIDQGALYHMLQNRLYRGEIIRKRSTYPSQHNAIIGAELWERIQSCLVENRVERDAGAEPAARTLLTGLVFDETGDRMSPTHANKKGRRYRYYVSQSLIKRRRQAVSSQARRVPAADLEAIVEGQICALLQDQRAIYHMAALARLEPRCCKIVLSGAAELSQGWPSLRSAERRTMLQALIVRVTVRAEAIQIEIRPTALLGLVGPADLGALPTDVTTTVVSVSATLKRSGMQTKLLVNSGQPDQREPDRSLVRVLGQAQQYREMVLAGQGTGMRALAADMGVHPSYFARTFRLAFLSPKIVHAILDGRQPFELTANKLNQVTNIAIAWSDQSHQLGFA